MILGTEYFAKLTGFAVNFLTGLVSVTLPSARLVSVSERPEASSGSSILTLDTVWFPFSFSATSTSAAESLVVSSPDTLISGVDVVAGASEGEKSPTDWDWFTTSCVLCSAITNSILDAISDGNWWQRCGMSGVLVTARSPPRLPAGGSVPKDAQRAGRRDARSKSEGRGGELRELIKHLEGEYKGVGRDWCVVEANEIGVPKGCAEVQVRSGAAIIDLLGRLLSYGLPCQSLRDAAFLSSHAGFTSATTARSTTGAR
jgi:hypothetical protein